MSESTISSDSVQSRSGTDHVSAGEQARKLEYALGSVTLKTAITHTVTYFVIGFLAFTTFDYASKFADPVVANFMRQTSDPLVAAGPLFQVIRGALFGLIVYLLRDVLLARRFGWLVMWLVLVVVGVLSPFGAAPSSIEGLLYTNLPLWFHVAGLPEVIVQPLLLSLLTYYWINHPQKKWLSWIMGLAFALVLLMATLGTLAGIGLFPAP